MSFISPLRKGPYDARPLKILVFSYLWMAVAFHVALGDQLPVTGSELKATLVSAIDSSGFEFSIKNLSRQPIQISPQIVALTPLRAEYLAKNPTPKDGVVRVFMTLVPRGAASIQWNETPMGGIAMVPKTIGAGETACVELQFTHGAQALIEQSQSVKLSFNMSGIELLKISLAKTRGTWMERDR